ncbi:hypothetical protein [Streptomyces prunicolor]
MPEYSHEQNLRLAQQMLDQQGQINNLTKERDSLGREADRLRRDWVAMRERVEAAETVIAQVREVQSFAEKVIETSGPGPASAVQAVVDRLRTALGQPDGEHTYLSTGCLHGDHDYCKSMTGLNGAKRPASCKKCGAACICGCHTTTKEPQ